MTPQKGWYTPASVSFRLLIWVGDFSVWPIRSGRFGLSRFGLGRFGLGPFRSGYEILQKSYMFTF